MTTAAEHYERLLAEHYTWMLGGDIEAAASGQAALLADAGLPVGTGEGGGDIAVDLGCGPGPQTLALARHGYARVIAVDTSTRLLDELTAHAADAGLAGTIRPVHGDIRQALPQVLDAAKAAVIVCMGDTLPHLPSKADVSRLLHDVATALRPGGRFLATYRDLSREVQGTDRFIPVRGTDDRLLTCFLDYTDDDTVQVHDLLHLRGADGGWELRTSSYPKLRLDPTWLANQCREAGLDVRHAAPGPRGLHILHATKPDS
ncbi:class I SAM-dependent methyltransferase [Streptomyces sp. NK08204]|uniref:class I SAM-dependent methyltransferase n=1 Tax=Streptomyces sp. NK08204 TaxID=2873260 RepID=UPI001CEC0F51|nr:class I SAM-dependent methyltransferase [Streptomyces sp. NK08204]